MTWSSGKNQTHIGSQPKWLAVQIGSEILSTEKDAVTAWAVAVSQLPVSWAIWN